MLCPRAPPAEGPVWKCLSLRKCYLLSGGNITATHVIYFLLFICFPQEVAKSGRHEFSPEGDAAKIALVLLGAEWKSVVVRVPLLLLAHRFPGQRTG